MYLRKSLGGPEQLEARNLLTGIPELVADINTTPTSLRRFRDPVVIDDLMYFVADDGVSGAELWRTDGTNSGTFLLKDIAEGRESSFPGYLTNVDGTLFFEINDTQVWKSDGTPAGTVKVRDIVPPTDFADVEGFTAFDDKLYFIADTEQQGRQVWVSDGTEAGTTPIGLDAETTPSALTRAGDALYFNLETTDGHFANRLDDASDEPTNVIQLQFPAESFVEFGGQLLILSTNSTLHAVMEDELVSLDNADGPGFVTETEIVGDRFYFVQGQQLHWLDANLNINEVSTANVTDLNDVNGKLYFRDHKEWYTVDEHDQRLPLGEINPNGSIGSLPLGFPQTTLAVGNSLYFNASDGENGMEIWRTDGGPPVSVTNLPDDSSFLPVELVQFGTHIYFGTRNQIWRTDGETTEPFFSNRTASSFPSDVMTIGEKLFFTALESENRQLWVTDADSTIQLTSFHGMDFSEFVEFDDKLYFVVSATDASDSTTEYELWYTDGSIDGTQDVFTLGFEPTELIPARRGIYFRSAVTEPVPPASTANSLWFTDGRTADGTYQLGLFANLENIAIARVSDDLYFNSTIGPGGLWRITNEPDQTPELVLEDRFTQNAVILGNSVVRTYVTTFDEGLSLHRIGTGADGVVELVNTGEFDSCNPGFDVSCDLSWIIDDEDGGAFFVFSTGGGPDQRSGMELWHTNGTPEGTRLVKDIRPGRESSNPLFPIMHNGVLYFTADADGTGHEIWRSNGTDAGTVQVTDGFGSVSILSNEIEGFASLGNRLYFTAEDGRGTELWSTDGTANETRRVADLMPGPEGSKPEFLTVVGDHLYFTADNGVTGRELWRLKPSIPGDLDGDGDVDSADRTMLTQNWTGAQSTNVGKTLKDGDLDGDGDVDSADLTIFSASWTGAIEVNPEPLTTSALATDRIFSRFIP